MRELSKDGLTLRWPELPETPDRKVLVEAGPPSPGQVLNIIYTLDGGPERLCRAWPVGVNPETGFQTFAARLPDAPSGTSLDWWPVLTQGNRELAPARAPVTDPAPGVASPPRPQGLPTPFPFDMQHLARVSVPLEKTPTMIGDTPEGLMIVFPLGSGGTLTGPKINGTIAHLGGDWMRVRPDGVGISEVRVVIGCDDGSTLLGEYGGVVNFGPDGYAALSKGGGPKSADVQLVPRFVTASTRFEWLNRVQCVGLGRVKMSELLVEYDLYAIHALAIPDGGGLDA